MSDFTYVDHIDLALIDPSEYLPLEDTSYECEYLLENSNCLIKPCPYGISRGEYWREEIPNYLCEFHYLLLSGGLNDDATLIALVRARQGNV